MPVTGHLARQAREAANDPARCPENHIPRTRRDWIWSGLIMLLVFGSQAVLDHVSVLAGLGVFAVGTAVLGVLSLRY